MSLNNIREQNSRRSFENIFFKPKNEQISHLPSIDKSTPKAFNMKSSSTILSNNESLTKFAKNPEVNAFLINKTYSFHLKMFYKEINQRLILQKKEIDKRNEAITTLQKNFDEIRINFLREKNENLEKTREIQNLKQAIISLNSELQNGTPKFFSILIL